MVITPSSLERSWALTRLEIAITKIASTIPLDNIVGSNHVRLHSALRFRFERKESSWTMETRSTLTQFFVHSISLKTTADIHNYDASQVPPEWHGWMMHMNDATPDMEEEYIKDRLSHKKVGEITHVPWTHNLGHQEPYFNFHNMYNQSQVRSRGYGIGNYVVGLPPGAPDAFYTQPGSPYNPASIRPNLPVGDLDEASGGGRPYKSVKWMDRLKTASEKEAEKLAVDSEWTKGYEAKKTGKRLSPREQAILARGGTLAN